ncbi:ATP-binding protein [Massilia sp. YIM B02763]|uniref:ATP-binding protein n=1 Tax=Massilia sp. YIM B02763 TaxID=3050130 RepID=UPI0025B63977|nr:ATP-binding protein [Massilia sp. YIM B02763]MDN4054390.1 ATP-binding protein [Massilia sp. YIM B02763]
METQHSSTAGTRAPMEGDGVRMVVFVGAESTGKSTLAEFLARAYGTVSVPEIGRFIWEEKQGRLGPDDYVEIALRHRQAEDAARPQARRWLFVDTNALTTLLLGIQFKQVGDPPPAALLRCADECRTRYAHTFVCADDIPYEEQEVRENEAWRGRIQQLVLQDLEARGIPHTVLHGGVEERARQVRAVLDAA